MVYAFINISINCLNYIEAQNKLWIYDEAQHAHTKQYLKDWHLQKQGAENP